MTIAWFYQFLEWLSNICLVIWRILACPFTGGSPWVGLPVASPVPPSTPSFIQAQEPNINADAMKIFQLECGYPRASRIARHKLAVQEDRHPQPIVHLSSSFSTSTDPSPGFSVLSDVNDNLIATPRLESPSLYSSPPSSPASSLNTPCIFVSGASDHDLSQGGGDTKTVELSSNSEPAIAESESAPDLASLKNDAAVSRSFRPDISDLAKRRKFRGPPILTNIPKELLFLPSRPTTPVNDNSKDDNNIPHPTLLTPKSAFAHVTDFVRSSATPKSPRASHDHDVRAASPESQIAFDQRSPFSTHAESFFADEHAASSPAVDIHNLDIYTVHELSPGVPTRRKRNAMHFDLGTRTSPILTHVYDGAIAEVTPSSRSKEDVEVTKRNLSWVSSSSLAFRGSLTCASPGVPESATNDMPAGPPKADSPLSISVAFPSTMATCEVVITDVCPTHEDPPTECCYTGMEETIRVTTVKDADMNSTPARNSLRSLVGPFGRDGSIDLDDKEDSACSSNVTELVGVEFDAKRASERSITRHALGSDTVSTILASKSAFFPVEVSLEPSFTDSHSYERSMRLHKAQSIKRGHIFAGEASSKCNRPPVDKSAALYYETSCVRTVVSSFASVSSSLSMDDIKLCEPSSIILNPKGNRWATIRQTLPVLSDLSATGSRFSVASSATENEKLYFESLEGSHDVSKHSLTSAVYLHSQNLHLDTRTPFPTDSLGSAAVSPISDGSSSTDISGSEILSPVTDDTCFEDSTDLVDDKEVKMGDTHNCLTDERHMIPVRARRIGIYGGLHQGHIPGSADIPLFTALPKRPDSIAFLAAKRTAAVERRMTMASFQCESKRVSALRPLMLPVRFGLCEANDAAGSRSSLIVDGSASSDAGNSIGRPPSTPLPDLPGLESFPKRNSYTDIQPSASTSTVNTEERLNALIELMDAMDFSQSPSTWSSPSMAPSYNPQSEVETRDDELNTQYWGVAL